MNFAKVTAIGSSDEEMRDRVAERGCVEQLGNTQSARGAVSARENARPCRCPMNYYQPTSGLLEGEDPMRILDADFVGLIPTDPLVLHHRQDVLEDVGRLQ